MDMGEIYQSYAQTVFRYLFSLTNDASLAEELTQETFYQAVKSIDRFDGSSKMTTFLFGIAKNVWLNEYRRRKKAPGPLPEAETVAVASVENDVLAKMGREDILRSIHNIPDPGREALYLRLLGSLSFSEIGSILGRTENWARVTYYRAKQQLIKEMQNDESKTEL